MKQVNIGVGHGLAVLVNDSARQMALGLVGTLDVDFALATFHDADGIESTSLWLVLSAAKCTQSCQRTRNLP